MNELKIANDLSLPLDAVTQKLAWLGRTGSGKTYGAKRMVEQMIRAGAQVVILDPVGVWAGLRLGPNSLNVAVLGGLFGDIPLEHTAGAVVADLVVDHGSSMVLDLSQALDAPRTRFCQAFAERFFMRKKAAPGAVHLVLEECQEFVPQNHQHGEEKMLHEFQRIAKLGRNFGIGLSLISQRPQEVNKKSLNLAEILFAFQMTGPQERKTIEGWIAEKGIDEDIASELPKLARGEPHVWSPALLKISRRVQIDRKTTFDASSTPKVGKEAAARQLSPIDLEQLRTDMAATIEKAKAEDPQLLRDQIAKITAENRAEVSRLKRELEQARGRVSEVTSEDVLNAEVRGKRVGWLAALQRVKSAGEGFSEFAGTLVAMVQDATSSFHKDVDELIKNAPAEGKGAHLDGGAAAQRQAPASRPRAALPKPAERAAAAPIAEGLSSPEQRVLDSLAWWASIGVDTPDKTQIGFLAGYRVSGNAGGTFGNILGALRGRGLLEYPSPGKGTLTPDGSRLARGPQDAPTTEVLQRAIFDRLDNPEGRVLRAIIDAYPDQLTKQEAGARSGYTVTGNAGGTFGNILGRLRSLGVIGYPAPGKVVALPVLFING